MGRAACWGRLQAIAYGTEHSRSNYWRHAVADHPEAVPNGRMETVAIRKALQASGLPNGDDAIFFGMDRSHRLEAPSIGPGSCPKGRALSIPRKSRMPPDLVEAALRDSSEAESDTLRVERRPMSSKPAAASQFSGVGRRPATAGSLPVIEPSGVLFEFTRGHQIGDRVADGRRRTHSRLDALLGHRSVQIATNADNEEARPSGRRAEGCRIPHHRAEQIVSVPHKSERCVERRSSRGEPEATHVLHYEKFRTDLRDQAKEMAKQLSTRVLLQSQPHLAEALARWAADQAIDVAPSVSTQALTCRPGQVSKVERRRWEIQAERRCEDGIAIVGRNDIKASRVCA